MQLKRLVGYPALCVGFLTYQAGSLVVNGTPEDDDFAPAGTGNAGFDSGTQTITVDLGSVAWGSPVISITFDAAIR